MIHKSLRHVLITAFALGAIPVFTQAAGAQVASARVRAVDTIPAEYRPPAGMCRVWIDAVPAARQPAPTDCATAVANKPANSRVIYGEEANRAKGGKNERLPVRGFAPPGANNKKDPIKSAIPDQPRGTIRTPNESWESKRISDQQLFGDRPANTPASSYPAVSSGATAAGATQTNGTNGSGILGDPRYFSGNNSVNPPGTGSSVCLDRDQDGWCDDMRFGPPTCLDQDKDGRCDDLPEYASQAYPQTLPHMRSASDVIDGRGSVEVARWLGTNEFTVKVPDSGRGGTPYRAIFLDLRGQLLQVWTDRNRDGMADRVEVYRDGALIKQIQR